MFVVIFITRESFTNFKGSPISKALTYLKVYIYKENGNFVKETDTSGYIVV